MLNKVILMGRITAEPELKYTSTDVANVRFTIAVDRRFQKQGEEKQTDFITCVAWRQTAEFIAKYFTKGRMINVVGNIQTRTWDDKQTGQKRYGSDVVVDEVNFCGDKQAENKQENEQENKNDGFVPIDDADIPF